MKSADHWFYEYSQTHQNPVNQKIHYICVPLIFWSAAAFFWVIPWPPGGKNLFANWATIAFVPLLLFYSQLGIRYFLMMIAACVVTLLSLFVVSNYIQHVGWTAICLFILCWIGQFYGHHIEGKKPSFFTDLTFLFIGPLWILKKLTD